MMFKILDASEFLQSLECNSINITTYLYDKVFSLVLRGFIASEKYNRKYNYNSNNKHYVYICSDKKQIIAVQYFNHNKWGNSGELFSIYVDKNFREKNIAKILIQKSIEYLLKENITKIKVPLTKCHEITPACYILKNHFELLKLKYKDKVELQVIYCE